MGDDYHCERSGHNYCLLRELYQPGFLEKMNISRVLSGEHTIGEGALEDITDGCGNNCIRKKIAAKSLTRRWIEQMRCVSEYREVLNESMGGNVSLDNAGIRWIKDGFAAIFSGVYEEKKETREEIHHEDLTACVLRRGWDL